MKTIYNGFFTVVLALMASTAFAQGIITGTVMDAELNEPLPGANVVVKGTTTGVSTDFDGNFRIEVPSNSGTLVISYIGFTKKEVPFTSTGNIGTIVLQGNADELEGVVVVGSGIIDLAHGRQTPIAVSSIGVAEIQAKAVGNVEFPEIMKNTPSVYVANQAGGFGDSQMFVRGFDQTNTAFLLNGQPINGMEDGRVYWSNWSGMSDVANAVQVQRGLGASKLAISSVGGTVNIVSRAAGREEGGFARFMTGNDSFFKGTVSYDSGLKGKWAYSVLLDYWQGHRKFAEGTAGQGQNYFFGVSYVPNDRHTFNFLLTGAPQWHDQNYSVGMDVYQQYGLKNNTNSGFLDGERFNIRRNYYHKPIANLNWDWDIDDRLQLSSVLYASWGRGGGTGPGSSSPFNNLNEKGRIDFDAVVADNIANADSNGYAGYGAGIRRMSVNMHNWYGFLSNLQFEPNENWSLNIGLDSRLYTGHHWYQMNNLLGLNGYTDNFGYVGQRDEDYVITETFKADPWSALFNKADKDQRFNYDYSENINYIGGFGQAEYKNDGFSAYVQAAVSTQSYRREGRSIGTEIQGVNGLGKSKKVNKTGYNIKGGLSYSINEEHTFFGNAGHFSRQPFLDNIFDDIRNSNYILEGENEVDNEEITSFEAGYQLRLPDFSLDFNYYHTTWGNRFVSGSRIPGDENAPEDSPQSRDTFQRFTDVTQVHQGVELEVKYRYANLFTAKAFGSLGNWKYDGTTPVQTRDYENNELISESEVDLTGTKIGNAPQTSFGAGIDFNVTENLSVDADYNYFSKLYGFVDSEDVIDAALRGETYQSERLNDYSLVNAGITYRFNFGDNNFTVRGNVFNLFNHIYINQLESYGYFYGNGRTWNLSVRYNF